MANSATNDNPEAQKRRSSRIVQAVPLTVSGVDALGRPFQERTSTLIINCHGCRYQSKHYVLKNMWLTLEVPHPDAGHAPRNVRARVMWIRRPHTVREMFQVGVEMETPGNLWGIAFPPHDWFPFPEAGGGNEILAMDSSPAFTPAPENESNMSSEIPVAPENNLRTMPVNTGNDSAVLLGRQMTRLVNEARQQLQGAIRESAASAVSAETRPLIGALHAQLEEAAKHSVAGAVEQALQGLLDRSVQAGETQLQQLREEWNRQLAETVEQARQTLHARVVEVEESRRTGFAQTLDAESSKAIETLQTITRDFKSAVAEAQEKLSSLSEQAEHTAAPAIHEIQQLLQTHSDQAHAQFAEFERSAQQWHEQMNAAASAAQEGFQARLEADLQNAGGRLDQRVETSLEDAVRQAADRLTRRSQETAEQIERETALRIEAMGKALSEASASAEQKLASLRGNFDEQESRARDILSRVEASRQEVERQTAQFESVRQASLQEMERHGAALLDVQTNELSRRAELALNQWTGNLQPTLEAVGRDIVVRLGSELENEFSSRLERAGDILQQLANGTRDAEEASRRHREEAGQISEQAVQDTMARMQETIGRLEQSFEESSRAASAKWCAEIEAKATETSHTTFETLFKTSEWYEKKANTQMQTTLEKGLTQANESLREKAGEISRLFAAEMDHYSRSYVEHTSGQIEEAARASVLGARQQAAALSAASVSAIALETQKQTEAALGQFRDKTASALEQLSAQFDELARKARAKFDADTAMSQEAFRGALLQDAQQAIRNARQDLSAQTEAAKEDVRAEGQRSAAQLQGDLGAAGERALESYRKRLESASNTWLLTTVSKLSQQSAEQLDAMAKSTETRLRETCAQVFANVGDSLRRRLMDLSTPSPELPSPPPANWPPKEE